MDIYLYLYSMWNFEKCKKMAKIGWNILKKVHKITPNILYNNNCKNALTPSLGYLFPSGTCQYWEHFFLNNFQRYATMCSSVTENHIFKKNIVRRDTKLLYHVDWYFWGRNTFKFYIIIRHYIWLVMIKHNLRLNIFLF